MVIFWRLPFFSDSGQPGWQGHSELIARGRPPLAQGLPRAFKHGQGGEKYSLHHRGAETVARK